MGSFSREVIWGAYEGAKNLPQGSPRDTESAAILMAQIEQTLDYYTELATTYGHIRG